MNILTDSNGVALLNMAGYRFYKHEVGTDNDYYVTSAQKRFDDDKGKKYFITVNIHNLADTGLPSPWRYDASVQFMTGQSDDEVFDVTYHATGKTIEQIEAFCEKLWTRMECSRYEDNYV